MVGVIVGIAIAVCGYKPYQIEMEYRRNSAATLESRTVHCFALVRTDFIKVFHWPQCQ